MMIMMKPLKYYRVGFYTASVDHITFPIKMFSVGKKKCMSYYFSVLLDFEFHESLSYSQ